MRIRQVKPAFWSDKVMAGLTRSARLTYIGLWMLADDAGWIQWDAEQAGAELFPYESVKRREKELAADLDLLVATCRVVRHDCGCIEVPHLSEHQRISGVRSFRARDAHAKHSPLSAKQVPLSDSPGTVRVGNGKERNGTVDAREAPKSGEGLKARLGQYEDVMAAKQAIDTDWIESGKP